MALTLLVWLACSRDGVGVGVPWLEVPDALSFEATPLDGIGTATLLVTNTGTAEARLAATVGAPFRVQEVPATLAPGASVDLLVSFEPTDAGAARGVLTLSSGLDAFEVRLDGTVDPDADHDGHTDPRAGGDDCDDHDPDRAPGLDERCDGLDDDCDGAVDEDPADTPWTWPDTDGDGYGDGSAEPERACDPPADRVVDDTDCDDRDPGTHPGAPDAWYDGVDADCAGNDDYDRDGDGVRDPSGGGDDCDDDDPDTRPGAPELDDGRDQDCDGLRDEDLWVAGSLLVTEIMGDPRAVSPAHGRYLEVFDPTDGDVDLGQVQVVVDGHRAPLGAGWLAPGGVVLLCSDPDPARNGGLACAGLLPWIGSPARVELRVAATGFLLDAVPIGGWPLPTGASLELASDALDPVLDDQLLHWCRATATSPTGDLGTPGEVSPPCP